MLIRLGRKAQSTAEYAALFAIVAALLATMSIYARRGVQARLKDGVDGAASFVEGQAGLGILHSGSGGSQYEPYYSAQGTRNLQSTSAEGLERGVDSEKGGQRALTGALRGSTTGTSSTTTHSLAD